MIDEYLGKNEHYTIIDYNEGLILTSHGRIFKKIDRNNDDETEQYDFIEMPKCILGDYQYVEILNSRKQMQTFCVHDLVFVLFKSYFDRRFFRVVHRNRDTLDNRVENLKIEFRRKDKKFIERYENAINLFLDEDFL